MDTDEVLCRNPIFYVVGATGSGKSLAAVKVAKTLQLRCGFKHVVVVNCDVMQFYADLPIATNKVSSAEMEGVPHCFIGFLSFRGIKIRDPATPYNGCDKEVREIVNDFGEDKIYNIHSYVRDVVEFIETFFREHPFGAVIVCGGTCYYAQALMFKNVLTDEDGEDSASFGPESSPLLYVESAESAALWQELNRVDPTVAVRYHPNDTRRVTRLLEIYRKTNRLPSEIYASRSDPCFRFPPSRCFVLWTQVEHEKLRKTLEERVDRMIDKGIVDEFVEFAKRQMKDGFDVAIAKAIGFKEFISAFDMEGGEVRLKAVHELDNSVELLKRNTKRYARQQNQWIKNRFLGRFWTAFISQQGVSNFVCVEASKTILEFIEVIEATTEFWIKKGFKPISGITFPLSEKREQPLAVQQEWCPDCKLFVCGGDRLKTHLTSKRHRSAFKHAALVRDQQEKYGRVIPRKKNRSF